jgi:hypothetical protein
VSDIPGFRLSIKVDGQKDEVMFKLYSAEFGDDGTAAAFTSRREMTDHQDRTVELPGGGTLALRFSFQECAEITRSALETTEDIQCILDPTAPSKSGWPCPSRDAHVREDEAGAGLFARITRLRACVTHTYHPSF